MMFKGVYWHVFPTFSEAKDAVWRDPNMLFNIIPKEFIVKKNEVELVLYLTSGSVYQLKGSNDPDYLRGSGPRGLVLDEFAKMKYEAWQVLEPTVRANDGWAWFIGTPKGKNHLFHHYVRGQEDNKEWKSWLLKASQSGIIAPDQLIEARKTAHSQSFFNQEYECAFLEGEGAVFRNMQSVLTAMYEKPDTTHSYVMGVDLAKHTDYTVIAVYDRNTNRQVYQDRFNQIDWVLQKKRIKALSDLYNRAVVWIDATGLGDPIYDDLARAGVPVMGYKLSNASKRDLIEQLSIMIDQRIISMLPLEETKNEFENFSYEQSDRGVIYYGAPDGLHDDIVIAHALAVWSLRPQIYERTEKPKTRLERAYEQAKANNIGSGEDGLWDEWSAL